MSEQIREQLSAFLDGELPDSETELLLKRLSRDATLREGFGRYALIGEVMRTPEGGPLARSLVEGINRRIDGEPQQTPVVATVAKARRWWRPIAGAAVAAGVAAVAVVTLEHRTDLPLTASAARPLASAPSTLSAPTVQAPPARLAASTSSLPAGSAPREPVSYVVPAVSPEPSAMLPAARLTNYVFAHSKYSSPLGQRNVLSGLVSDQPETNAVPPDPRIAVPAAAPAVEDGQSVGPGP
ncbi:MAG: RseA family anti-sigma factor [Steroidobacteraceae bacterium]